MRSRKTAKIDWAAIHLYDNHAVISFRHEGAWCDQYFSSLDDLKQALHEKQLQVRRWGVSVPRAHCILKTLTLPAPTMDEAMRMVEFEIPS
ncbi:MAG: hypothetical protein MI892_13865, partial [Desulfobacterales bacterium]|nr:hypothetical protein [Desulfobacterales bacterium]